jgi:hypothetical protein
MHLIVIAWCEFWLAVLTPLPPPPERRTATIYHLDDYRPTNDNDTNGKKPPRRAA